MAADPRARAEHIIGVMFLASLVRQGLRVVDAVAEGTDPRHVATLREIAQLAEEVRGAQRRFFELTRAGRHEDKAAALATSKRLEARLDRALVEWEALQAGRSPR